MATLLGYEEPQILEVFKNILPTKLYWILFPIEDLRQGNNKRDPLTAVLIVSMTVTPNCPCLYRVSLISVMSLYDLITGRKCCAKLHSFLLVSVVYPAESHD